MILWTDYGESFLRVSLEVRRGFLRALESEAYAAIGRRVVSEITDPVRFKSPPWLTPTIIVDKETQYVVVAWVEFR